MVRNGHFFGASLPKEKAKKGPCFSYRSVSLCHPLHASKGEFAGFGKYAGCTYDSVELPAALAFEVHPTENDTWLPKNPKKSRKRVSRYATKAAPQKPPTSEVERMLAFCASKVGRGEDVEEVHSVHVTRDDAVIWGAGPRQSPTLAQLVSGLVGAPRRKLLKLHNAISASHAPDEERSPFYSEKSSLSFKFLSAALQFLRAVVRKDIGDIAELLAPNCEMDQFGEFYEGKRECLAWYKAHLQIHSKQLREEVEEEVEPLAYRFPAICCVDVAHRCVDYRFECLVPGQEAVGVQVLHMNRELRVVKIQTVYHKLPAIRAMGDGDAETPLEAEEEEHSPSDDSPLPEIHFSALAALRSSSARSVITADLPPPPPPKVWVKAAPPVVIYFEDCDACQPLLDAALELNCDLYRISADGLVDDDEIAALSTRLALERNTTVYCNGPLEKIAKCLTPAQRKFTALGAYAPLVPGEQSLEDVEDGNSNILTLLRDSCYPGFVSLHLNGPQLEAWSTELCADAVFPEEGRIEITPAAEAKVREEIAAWWDREVETEWASLYIDADVGEDGVTNTPAMRMKVHATNKGTTTVVPEVVRSGASLYEQLLPLLKERSGNEIVSLRQSFSESSVSKMNVDVAYEREKNLFTVCETYGENAQPRKFKQQLEEFLNTQVAPLLPLDLSVMAGESAGDADFAPSPLIFHGEFAVLAEGSRPVGWGSDVILNEWHAFRWGPGVAGKCAESGENLFAKVLGAAGAGKTEEDIGAEIAALEAELGIAEDNADA
eukprot:g3156.t1